MKETEEDPRHVPGTRERKRFLAGLLNFKKKQLEHTTRHIEEIEQELATYET